MKVKTGKCIDCEEGAPDVPIISNRCHTHYWRYRRSLKPVLPKKRVAIKKISAKQAEKQKEYTKLRKAFLFQHPMCIARLDGCNGKANDIHHTEGRTGDLYLDVNTWVPLCRNCHIFVETHPEKAKELGLSYSRLNKK